MSETTTNTRPSGRHPVNIGHLVMGLAFVGLVGVWALIQADVVDHHDIRWLLPVPRLIAGIAGLLATTLTSRDRWGSQQTGWVDSGTTHRSGWAQSGPTHQTGWVRPDETAPSGDTAGETTTYTTTDPTEETR